MVTSFKPANRPAENGQPELARTGHCIGYAITGKCSCQKLTDPSVVKDWETCGACGHTSFVHEWEPVSA